MKTTLFVKDSLAAAKKSSAASAIQLAHSLFSTIHTARLFPNALNVLMSCFLAELRRDFGGKELRVEEIQELIEAILKAIRVEATLSAFPSKGLGPARTQQSISVIVNFFQDGWINKGPLLLTVNFMMDDFGNVYQQSFTRPAATPPAAVA